MKNMVLSLIAIILLINSYVLAYDQDDSAKSYWQDFTQSLRKIENVFYETRMTVYKGQEEIGSGPSISKNWFNRRNFRRQTSVNVEGKNPRSEIIVRPDGSYMKGQDSDTFKKTQEGQFLAAKDLFMEPIFNKYYSNAKYEILGKDMIKGQEVIILEISIPTEKATYVDTYWIDVERKLPLKHKSKWDIDNVTFTISEFDSYNFSEISEDIFDVEENWGEQSNKGSIEDNAEKESITSDSAYKRKKILYTKENKQGIERLYYKDGKLKAEINWQDGVEHGKCNFYDKDGNLIQKGQFKNGVETGKWLYFQNSYVEFEVTYDNGKSMLLKGFSKEGDLQEETIMEDGNTVIKKFYNNGKLRSKKVIEKEN